MSESPSYNESLIRWQTSILHKIKIYIELTKPRLSLLVVFSAICGYFMATYEIAWLKILYIGLGGYLVTGASNIFNQIIEKNTDALMKRTENRPIPTERISNIEAFIFATLIGLVGLSILFTLLNPLSGWLGLLSMFMYVLLYTPLKSKSSLSVFVGAFPGAIPPMLGYIGESGSFGLVPGLLFALQFIWQFPHFWAIAWKCHEDYSKAGLKMLPLHGGKTNHNAFYVFMYTLFILPMSYLIYHFQIAGTIYLFVSTGLGLYFILKAYQFYREKSDKKSLQLMFASFVYLPIVQIVMVLDKI